MSSHSHEIVVVKKHESGAEEWFCPTCRRRFVVNWSPEYQCIILTPGDEVAIHNIARGALTVLSNEISADDVTLSAFADWLDRFDIESELDQDSD